MRVYVPATVAMLRTLVADGEFHPVSRTAFAVTPTLREAYSSGDDEELAEVAMNEAARASLRLVGAALEDEGDGVVDGSVVFRRAVIAADVEDPTLRPDLDDAVVRLKEPLRMSEVASVHVDLEGAESAVEKAVGVVDAADMGDPDAEFVLGDAEDHALAWYATQELPFLLEFL
ncbi:hypothetical protein CH289_25555 [Rhodococcus sp. RS1C4]|uniref:DUF6912 family protein n=1 Tax=Nocardiaceae TaxID=85025 RepID=UPI000363117B|nr:MULTISPECIES: hypothetical protein [Rhodococcus]OZC44088.1 hypothetical protein CH289_25555 [Rhodococcus sp. RS1C4]OZC62249.1 hypothetical protein CH267_01550 [Rhodococcus sp. 06-621-2]OZC79894.1 hypothetical protein CH282_19795 [Rhodococcus sp. 06-418-1B]OZD19367.1 hypothetical protein CH253_16110 [Rhodococcus sp. 06-156-3C]OZD21701.1 hypothetical protein CH280_02025 [Rhodococcus sp. 06-156-4C]